MLKNPGKHGEFWQDPKIQRISTQSTPLHSHRRVVRPCHARTCAGFPVLKYQLSYRASDTPVTDSGRRRSANIRAPPDSPREDDEPRRRLEPVPFSTAPAKGREVAEPRPSRSPTARYSAFRLPHSVQFSHAVQKIAIKNRNDFSRFGKPKFPNLNCRMH